MSKQTSIAIEAKDFRHVIAIAALAAERRAIIPILSQLRCRANGHFEVCGTDLDTLVTARIDHGGGPAASFMLPEARSLADAVRAAGGNEVALTARDGKIRLSSGALAMTVERPLPPEDFPDDADMAVQTFNATLSMEQVRSFARVASSISTEETRYYLNGLYFHHLEGSTYRAVATDGHRMAFVEFDLPDADGSLAGVILPRKAIRMMLHLAGKPSGRDEGVRLAIGNRHAPNCETSTAPEKIVGATRASLSFTVGGADVTVATKLIDGTFPDYRRVIPNVSDEDAKIFVFDTSELRRGVEALRHCASGRVRAVKMAFETNSVVISAMYHDTGIQSVMRVPCQHRHAGFEIGFNGGYLLAMIEAAGPGELVMRLADPSAPTLIKNPADPAWTGLLMPMRV